MKIKEIKFGKSIVVHDHEGFRDKQFYRVEMLADLSAGESATTALESLRQKVMNVETKLKQGVPLNKRK